jgi:uncharacterized Tic20 family protein
MPEHPAQQRNDDKNSRIWGMLCHLSALLGILGIPFGNLIGPLVIWLLKRNTYPFVDQQGREALNFQISMTIYTLFAALLYFLKMGMFLLLIIAGINFILVIIASLKAYNGETYRYPFTLQLIKK